MIETVECLVNDYWMYDKEPFNVIRFSEDNKVYLFGKNIITSLGIDKKRKQKGYLVPSISQIIEAESLVGITHEN